MRFETGLWNYIDGDKYPFPAARMAEEWAELSVTLGCSFATDGSKQQNKPVVRLIKAAAKRNIRLFVYDKRVYWKNFREKGREGYVRDVLASLKDFEKFGNVAGYIFCDEPNGNDMPDMLAALGEFKKLSGKTPFVNFSWCDARQKEYGSRENYARVVAETAKAGLSYVANDRYSAMHAKDYEPGFKETGTDKYFADLNLFKAAARAAQVPYIVSLLSVGHWMYRTPTETDIRWQLSTAVAHGADGIQWFFVNQHRFADDYYDYPVDIYGNRTPLFYAMARQTKYLKDKVITPLNDYTFSRVWHIGKAYGGTPLLNKDDAVLYVYADHGQNGIVSEFIKNGAP
ncbi:MAG: hypothetical protein ACI4SH_07115, partial [Candidatus Scatosoma sp.]